MKHLEEIEPLILRYAEDELAPDAMVEMREHLVSCKLCRDLLAEHESTLASLQAAFAVPPVTTALSAREIMSRAARRQTQRRIIRTSLATASVLAAIIGFAMINQDKKVPESLAADVRLEAIHERIAQLEAEIEELKANTSNRISNEFYFIREEREKIAAISYVAGLNQEERFRNIEGALTRYRYAIDYFLDTASARKAQARIDGLAHHVL